MPQYIIKDGEGKKMSSKIVIDRIRAKAKIKSETLGNLELKFISIGDIEIYEKRLSKVKDDREFVSRLIYNQQVSPEIVYKKFNKISEDELRKIARNFVKYEEYTFKYFKETTDDEFFHNFRIAIQNRIEEEQKRMQKLLSPVRGTLESFLRKQSGIVRQVQSAVSPLSRLVRETSQLTRLIENSQYYLIERMRPAILQFQATSDLIEKALKPQIEVWQKWADQNQEIFQSFSDHWKLFYDKYKISEEQAVKVLRKYKWFVTPSMPIAFVFEVVKIGSKRGNQRGEINGLFVDFFCSDDFEELEALVNGWKSNSIFKPRMKIFRDCINGLITARKKTNPSNFILPTLIAQIDGLLQEYMEKNGLSFDLKDRIWKDSTGQKIDWKKWYKSRTTNQDMDDLANEIFLNILFQRSHRGIALGTPFTFNRHKIMHGEYLRYGRIDNAIRAFLVLDFLASLK